jgi:hypothetical protein
MADNRAEASRLWAMMNRGGQMGMDVAGDPLAYAGGASVVPPPNYQGSYNPAGGWAEAGRLAPDNIAAANVAAMNQVTQPFGGVPSDLHGWPIGPETFGQPQMGGTMPIPNYTGMPEGFPNTMPIPGATALPEGVPSTMPLGGYPGMGVENMGFPHGLTAQGAVDPATGQLRVVPPGTSGGYGYEDEQGNWIDTSGASVVDPPRMLTEKETLDREVMGPSNERDAAFSKIHDAYYTGADFGYEQGWPERLGVPQEWINLYMAAPDEAKQYAHDNPTDAVLQQFEEKYGFPLDVSIEISM